VTQSSPARYRPEIDGLRAFAVLAVIFNHFNADVLPSGFLGVDVFFLISGFVITASLAGRGPFDTAADLLLGFYSRRVRRLLPALMVCVLVTAVAISFFDPRALQSLQTGLAALFGVSNLLLFHQATDYFAREASLNAFTHTWSLGVEEQFYLLFPLLVWFCGFRRAGAQAGERRLFAVTAIASMLSLVSFVVLCELQPAAAYFLMPCRFWEMGAGCLLFLGLQGDGRLRRLAGHLEGERWSTALLALLLASLALPRNLQALSTPVVVLLSSLLLLASGGGNRVGRLLRHPQAVRIGRISYSLYLWHWSVLVLSRWTIGIQWWTVPLQIGAMLLLSLASTDWLEEPLRRARWSSSSWRTIGIGLAASSLAALPLWSLAGPLKGRLYLGSPITDQGKRDGGPLRVRGTAVKPKNCSTDRFDEQILNDAAAFATKVERCTAVPGLPPGAPRPRQIWSVGDSHAMTFLPMLDQLYAEDGKAVALLARPGCPFPAPLSGTVDPSCGRFQSLVQERILQTARPGDVITISSYHLSYLGEEGRLEDTRRSFLGDDGKPLPSGPASRERWVEAVHDFSRRAAARGIRTVLIGATPRNLRQETCHREWFNLQPVDRCDREVRRELENAREMNRWLSSRLEPQVAWLDPLPILCPGGCDNQQTTAMLRDNDHLSAQAVLKLSAAYRSLLKPAPEQDR
jgi:peptidoglycan/LPS O-acetylase OafA/YrhL